MLHTGGGWAASGAQARGEEEGFGASSEGPLTARSILPAGGAHSGGEGAAPKVTGAFAVPAGSAHCTHAGVATIVRDGDGAVSVPPPHSSHTNHNAPSAAPFTRADERRRDELMRRAGAGELAASRRPASPPGEGKYMHTSRTHPIDGAGVRTPADGPLPLSLANRHGRQSSGVGLGAAPLLSTKSGTAVVGPLVLSSEDSEGAGREKGIRSRAASRRGSPTAGRGERDDVGGKGLSIRPPSPPYLLRSDADGGGRRRLSSPYAYATDSGGLAGGGMPPLSLAEEAELAELDARYDAFIAEGLRRMQQLAARGGGGVGIVGRQNGLVGNVWEGLRSSAVRFGGAGAAAVATAFGEGAGAARRRWVRIVGGDGDGPDVRSDAVTMMRSPLLGPGDESAAGGLTPAVQQRRQLTSSSTETGWWPLGGGGGGRGLAASLNPPPPTSLRRRLVAVDKFASLAVLVASLAAVCVALWALAPSTAAAAVVVDGGGDGRSPPLPPPTVGSEARALSSLDAPVGAQLLQTHTNDSTSLVTRPLLIPPQLQHMHASSPSPSFVWAHALFSSLVFLGALVSRMLCGTLSVQLMGAGGGGGGGRPRVGEDGGSSPPPSSLHTAELSSAQLHATLARPLSPPPPPPSQPSSTSTLAFPFRLFALRVLVFTLAAAGGVYFAAGGVFRLALAAEDDAMPRCVSSSLSSPSHSSPASGQRSFVHNMLRHVLRHAPCPIDASSSPHYPSTRTADTDHSLPRNGHHSLGIGVLSIGALPAEVALLLATDAVIAAASFAVVAAGLLLFALRRC